jgi:beta-glucanase (GH16 family)
MRKILLVCAVLVTLLVALSAGGAGAQSLDFRDDFNSFNSNRWLKSDHVLGRTDLDPNNVDVRNGNLRIKIPANTTSGGEVESMNFYQYGTYRARMKVADAPSSITGFFLYRSPDFYAEIDIEVYNDGSRDVDFVTYANGQQTHAAKKQLRFDPTANFHTYRFDYHPDAVHFYVDGTLMQSWTDGLPQDSMKLLVNTWFPSWLPGTAPTSDRYTRIEWIDYQQQ